MQQKPYVVCDAWNIYCLPGPLGIRRNSAPELGKPGGVLDRGQCPPALKIRALGLKLEGGLCEYWTNWRVTSIPHIFLNVSLRERPGWILAPSSYLWLTKLSTFLCLIFSTCKMEMLTVLRHFFFLVAGGGGRVERMKYDKTCKAFKVSGGLHTINISFYCYWDPTNPEMEMNMAYAKQQ